VLQRQQALQCIFIFGPAAAAQARYEAAEAQVHHICKAKSNEFPMVAL